MNRKRRCTSSFSCLAALLVAALVSQAGQAFAAIGLNSLKARAEVVANGIGNFPVVEDVTGNPAFATDTLTNGGVTSTATAQATYGSLKAYAQITKSPGIEPFNFADGNAQFIDVLTIDDGTGTGSGTVTFSFHLTGSLTDVNAGEVRSRVEFDLFMPDNGFQGYNQSFEVQSGTTRSLDEVLVTSPLTINFGVPFTLDVDLFAKAELEESETGTVTADFLNTAEFMSAVVSGGSGPITISSASGTNYAVPEPASAILLMLGAIGLMGRPRRG